MMQVLKYQTNYGISWKSLKRHSDLFLWQQKIYKKNNSSWETSLKSGMNVKSTYRKLKQTRKKKLFENNVFIAAIYLDPRFNYSGSSLITEEEKTIIITLTNKTYYRFSVLKKL